MKWTVVGPDRIPQPNSGEYSSWKPLLAKEGGYSCIYCAIPDHHWGGERVFHVEHFRPKSRFSELANDVANLFYACPICNGFKHEDWPCEPAADLEHAGYAPPSVDYNSLFSVSPSGLLQSTKASGRYMCERLFLNRAHLISVRREEGLLEAISAAIAELERSLPLLSEDHEMALLRAKARLADALLRLRSARQYGAADIRRR